MTHELGQCGSWLNTQLVRACHETCNTTRSARLLASRNVLGVAATVPHFYMMVLPTVMASVRAFSPD